MFNYQNNKQWIENLHIVMQLGLTMAGSIIFCFFIGYYLDEWLGTRGIFVTVFIVLGVLGGSNVVYRQIMEITSEADRPTPPHEKSESKPDGQADDGNG